MLTPSRQYGLRISLFYAGFFIMSGVITPFLPVWYKLRGLTPEEIGFCMAFPLAARFIFMPFGSWFANRAPSRRGAIQVFVIVGLLLFIPATVLEGFWPIFVLTGMSITVSGLVAPALDALALHGVRRFGLDFGSLRVWGSINFIVISSLAGVLLEWRGPGVLTWLIGGAILATLASSFILPRDKRVAPPPRQTRQRSVLSNRNFLSVILAGALMQSSHSVLYSFGTIYWQKLGFSGAEIGILWSFGVLAEVLMFAISGRTLRRMDAETLILVGCIGGIIRWILFPWAVVFPAALALQALHALTFAAIFAGMQIAISREIPDEMTISAQAMWQIASGLISAAGMVVSGPLYAALGGVSFQAMAVLAVAAIIVLKLPRPAPASPREPGLAG